MVETGEKSGRFCRISLVLVCQSGMMNLVAAREHLRRTPLFQWWVDRRASSIADPIERLKFLRTYALPPTDSAGPVPIAWKPALGAVLVLFLILQARSISSSSPPPPSATPVVVAAVAATPKANAAVPAIWLVETRNGVESYSNGLRIETRLETANRPRSYTPLNRRNGREPSSVPHHEIVGIVFHTTESNLAEFAPQANRTLKRYSEGILSYVREQKAYNYVIDRFGRVFRIVREDQTAFHAGPAVWADDRWVYVQVNDAFLGVSFETQSATGDASAIITPGQIASGRMLTDMLRHKHQIPAGNCPTHAQVSVNPSNMKIGYHTDWAGNFPYEEMGLPDNYLAPIPALTEFGFNYDPVFLTATGARLWKGLLTAEDIVREQAKAKGMSVAQWKSDLRDAYKKIQANMLAETSVERQGE